MKNNRNISIRICLFPIVLLFWNIGYSQQDNFYSFYTKQMQFINAAFTGVDGSVLGLNIRSQWASFEGAPEAHSAFFGTSIGKQTGIGFSVVSDKNLVEKNTNLMLDFSYHLQLNKESHMYFGLKTGLSQYSANLESLRTVYPGYDPLQQDITGSYKANIGIGFLFRLQQWSISFAVPRIMQPDRFQNTAERIKLGTAKPHWYASAARSWRLSPDYLWKPSVLFRYVNGFPLAVEFTSVLAIKKRIELGAKYRYDAAYGGLFVFKAGSLHLGYAYEASTEKSLNAVSNGTHEVILQLQW